MINGEQSTALEDIKIKIVVDEKIAVMEDLLAKSYLEDLNIGYELPVMTFCSAQPSLNTIKVII